MAYYDQLITKWATLNPGTTEAKLAEINALTVTGAAVPMIVQAYKIYDLIVSSEFTALTAANQTLVRDLLNMGEVDLSPGTKARAMLIARFPNGTATFTALGALAVGYDTPAIPWATATIAQGGGALGAPVAPSDLVQAGNLS